MQNREALVRRAYENGNPDRPAVVGNGEQSLHAGDIAHTHAQAAVLFIDFRHPIGIDGLLNADRTRCWLTLKNSNCSRAGRCSAASFEVMPIDCAQ